MTPDFSAAGAKIRQKSHRTRKKCPFFRAPPHQKTFYAAARQRGSCAGRLMAPQAAKIFLGGLKTQFLLVVFDPLGGGPKSQKDAESRETPEKPGASVCITFLSGAFRYPPFSKDLCSHMMRPGTPRAHPEGHSLACACSYLRLRKQQLACSSGR